MTMRSSHRVLWTALVVALAACGDDPTQPPPGEPPPPPEEPPPPAQVTVVLGAAGNIAKCSNNRDSITASMLEGMDWVAALGDNAFESGSLQEYTDCYGPTWGRFLDRTFATLGNHDYQTADAAGAWDYLGDRAGPRGRGYYSQDIGEWHVIVLNDNDSVPFRAGSEQETWLVADLAANTKPCTIVISHTPRFASTNTPGQVEWTGREFLWQHLYDANAEILLHGQRHHYERMAPMDPSGTRDDARGLRQFNVGTGGEAVEEPTAIHPNSESRAAAFGILKLTLKPDGYDWAFLGIPGVTFSDSGSGSCH
jgi:hypothetical protein